MTSSMGVPGLSHFPFWLLSFIVRRPYHPDERQSVFFWLNENRILSGEDDARFIAEENGRHAVPAAPGFQYPTALLITSSYVRHREQFNCNNGNVDSILLSTIRTLHGTTFQSPALSTHEYTSRKLTLLFDLSRL